MLKKLIVILGPTASGKSELAIKLAKKFNGEIVSADSRQVYKGMNIGTGKITPDTKNSSNFSTGQAKKKHIFTHKGIPHHCIDVASPKRRFTVVQYRQLALRAINKIFKSRTSTNRSEAKKKGNFKKGKLLRQKKLPLLCGGTGFYIQAVVDGILIPEVKPDWQLRKELEKKTTAELFNKLKKLDPRRAKTIDRNNKRRLIRALEIVVKTKKPVPLLKKQPLPYPVLMIGIKKELKTKINRRVEKMFKLGLEKEVKRLVKKYGWLTPLQTIGYQEWQDYFDRKINKNRVQELIATHTIQYAKRQMTWFKQDKRIKWVKNQKEAEKLVKKFC